MIITFIKFKEKDNTLSQDISFMKEQIYSTKMCIENLKKIGANTNLVESQLTLYRRILKRLKDSRRV